MQAFARCLAIEILVFFSTIHFVHGDGLPFLMSNPELANYRFSPENLNTFLLGTDQIHQGDTLHIGDLSDIIIGRFRDKDMYELRLGPDIKNLFERKMFIGQMNDMNQIIRIQITFYNDDDEVVLDRDSHPIDYVSTPTDLGHLLEILAERFLFAYAKCQLVLRPNTNFDPNSLFFHFPKFYLTDKSRANTCMDGIRNRDETGPDCGGKCAPYRKCSVGSRCRISADCRSGLCASNICLPAMCGNRQRDDGETDLNCGGPCAVGLKCNISQSCENSCDCDSGVCVSNVCLPSSCADGEKNFGETDVDCGGICNLGRKCPNYAACNISDDCISDICISTVCLPEHCGSSILDGGESDVDCGGTCAPGLKCNVSQTCQVSADCKSDTCVSNLCLPSFCNDGLKNNSETDVDCGGICNLGRKCPNYAACNISDDCISGVCVSGVCLPAACANGRHDQNETAPDCGGICAPGLKCNLSQSCNSACDCISGVCVAGACKPANCNNGRKDGNETDIDCGGGCAPEKTCSEYMRCINNSDCTNGSCVCGYCGVTVTVFRYNGGSSGHYYSTDNSQNGTLSDGNSSQAYYFEGPAFKVLTIPLPGTVPWYRYNISSYDSKYKIHWQAFLQNTAGIVSKGVTQNDIMGYVYRNQQCDTVPLYHYIQNATQNQFYTIADSEIGTTTTGVVGQYNFMCLGIPAYVLQ